MTSTAIPSHLACPACQQVTPLPSQTAPTAVVRCPHCRAQFALQDLLGDPEIVWESVSDTEQQQSDIQRSDPQGDLQAPVQSDSHAATDAERSDVSPGAETVEMPSSEALLESWKDEQPPQESSQQEGQQQLFEPTADVLFDSNQDFQSELHELESPPRETLDGSLASADTIDGPDPEGVVLEASPARKLEGPLVGEFPDDPEPELQYAGESSWRSATGPNAGEGSPGMGELGGDTGFRSFSGGPAERRNRPRRSPIWAMLQVTLGGLAAIPVSLLLMWHLLGTDIGDAAPWVARYAPWIVPQKFHAYAPPTATATNGQQLGSTADLSQPRLPAPGTAAGSPADPAESQTQESPADEIPSVQPRALSDVDLAADSMEAAAADAQNYDADSTADTLVKSGRSEDDRQPIHNYVAETPDSVDPADDRIEAFELDDKSLAAMLDGLDPPNINGHIAASTLENSTGDSTTDDYTTSLELDSFDNLASDSPADLDTAALENCFTLIRQSNLGLEEWSLAVRAKQHDLKLAQDTYSQLARLALAIDELPSRELVQQAIRRQLRPIREQVEQKLEVRNLIDQGARFWIRSQSQPAASGDLDANTATTLADGRYGLAMTAVIDSIAASDDGQWSIVAASATTPQSNGAKLPLDLRIPQDLIDLLPEGKLIEGQKLFLLGTAAQPTEDAVDDSTSAAGQPTFVANYLTQL